MSTDFEPVYPTAGGGGWWPGTEPDEHSCDHDSLQGNYPRSYPRGDGGDERPDELLDDPCSDYVPGVGVSSIVDPKETKETDADKKLQEEPVDPERVWHFETVADSLRLKGMEELIKTGRMFRELFKQTLMLAESYKFSLPKNRFLIGHCYWEDKPSLVIKDLSRGDFLVLTSEGLLWKIPKDNGSFLWQMRRLVFDEEIPQYGLETLGIVKTTLRKKDFEKKLKEALS